MARSRAALQHTYEDVVFKYDEYWEPHVLLSIGPEEIAMTRGNDEFEKVIYLMMRVRTTHYVL